MNSNIFDLDDTPGITDITRIFRTIGKFDGETIFKHLIFVCYDKKIFIYHPFISSSFYKECNTFLKSCFSTFDLSKAKHPAPLCRDTKNYRKKNVPEKRIIDDLKSFIERNPTLTSQYWLVFQFNLRSLSDTLYTENFPLSDDDKTKVCSYFLQIIINLNVDKILYSKYMQTSLYEYHKVSSIISDHPLLDRSIRHPSNILDANVDDDE